MSVITRGAQHQTAMQPSVGHFIVRPDADDGTPGPIVPLVAVDQLPGWLQLSGVPRELDAEQTIGLTNLGIVDNKDDSTFEVRLHHGKIRDILNNADEKTDLHSSGGGKGKAKATRKKKAAPHAETKSKSIEKTASEESLPTSAGTSPSTELGLVEKPKPPVHPAERMLSASRHNTASIAVGTQAPNNSNEKPLRPHMTEATRNESRPAAPKQPTTFCRHWCHHGSCKWGLECRYQHRMPMTVDGLREVGLKDFPTWYLLMMSGGGLPGLISMDAMLSGGGDGQPSPARQHAAAQKQPPSQPLNQHHVVDTPSMDLRLVQGRLSTLLASSGAASNRQKLKQLREVRHLLLRGANAAAIGAQGGQQQQQQPRPHNNSSNYANLYTNASVAANAASIRRQAERQQQVRDDMPVVTRVRARDVVEDNRSQAVVAGRAGFGENLLDID